MSMDLQSRFEFLIARLRDTYDGIGHSSGRPYVYFVYDPDKEKQFRLLVQQQLRSDQHLTFHHIDLLDITMESLSGQEEERQHLLNDSDATGSVDGIVLLWKRRTFRAITTSLQNTGEGERPVIVLQGLAALHPLTTPTSLIEFLAEQEPRNPNTNRMVPIVVFIPGTLPPQSSHVYEFLGQARLRQNFYRGEEI